MADNHSAGLPMIGVQVCYAGPERHLLRNLVVSHGTTMQQAIDASGALADMPGIDLSIYKTGIFGKLKPLDTLLRDGDRIEIYQPLIADPKESRRKRAEKKAPGKAA